MVGLSYRIASQLVKLVVPGKIILVGRTGSNHRTHRYRMIETFAQMPLVKQGKNKK